MKHTYLGHRRPDLNGAVRVDYGLLGADRRLGAQRHQAVVVVLWMDVSRQADSFRAKQRRWVHPTDERKDGWFFSLTYFFLLQLEGEEHDEPTRSIPPAITRATIDRSMHVKASRQLATGDKHSLIRCVKRQPTL